MQDSAWGVEDAVDHLLDFGPGAGRHGGRIVAQGQHTALGRKRASITGPYLTGKKAIPVPTNRRTAEQKKRKQTEKQFLDDERVKEIEEAFNTKVDLKSIKSIIIKYMLAYSIYLKVMILIPYHL